MFAIVSLQEGLPNSLARTAALVNPPAAKMVLDPPEAEELDLPEQAELDPPGVRDNQESKGSPRDHTPVERTSEKEPVHPKEGGAENIVMAIPIEGTQNKTAANATEAEYEEVSQLLPR